MLDFIAGYQDEHGWAPTMSEIGEAVGLASKSSVHKHLQTLRDEGQLVLGNGPRMIRLMGTIEVRRDRDPYEHVPPYSAPIPARHVAADGRLTPGR